MLNFYNNDDKNILEKKSDSVMFPLNRKNKDIIKELRDNLQSLGGAGLAAPQIGYNKQIVLCSYNRNVTEIECLINPSYELINNEVERRWEGCFSLPLTCSQVERYKNIFISYYNAYGIKKELTLSGEKACIFQHEYDHLHGILIIHKAIKTKTFNNADEYREFLIKHINSYN